MAAGPARRARRDEEFGRRPKKVEPVRLKYPPWQGWGSFFQFHLDLRGIDAEPCPNYWWLIRYIGRPFLPFRM